MREIKFRCWTGDKMRQCSVSQSGLAMLDFGETKSPIMQYTGLKDKQGKEIYEGDILKIKVKRLGGCSGVWYRKVNKNHGDYYLSAVVKDILGNLKYSKEEIEKLKQPIGKEIFEQEIGNDNNLFFNVYYSEKDWEVIGNIYENPELIK